MKAFLEKGRSLNHHDLSHRAHGLASSLLEAPREPEHHSTWHISPSSSPEHLNPLTEWMQCSQFPNDRNCIDSCLVHSTGKFAASRLFIPTASEVGQPASNSCWYILQRRRSCLGFVMASIPGTNTCMFDYWRGSAMNLAVPDTYCRALSQAQPTPALSKSLKPSSALSKAWPHHLSESPSLLPLGNSCSGSTSCSKMGRSLATESVLFNTGPCSVAEYAE